MKKAAAILLTFSLCFLLCSCESEEERAQRRFEESNAAYQEQKLKVDILKAEIEILDSAIEAMKNK